MNAYKVLNVPETANRDEIRKAYRALARRWHPDRFPEGPERDWANEHMAQINMAYKACLCGARDALHESTVEKDKLERVSRMIDDGQYNAARKLLMGLDTRCAEWNYLFGAILLRMNDLEKALIYLSVAAHQMPQSAKYARALSEAQRLKTTPINRLANRFARIIRSF